MDLRVRELRQEWEERGRLHGQGKAVENISFMWLQKLRLLNVFRFTLPIILKPGNSFTVFYQKTFEVIRSSFTANFQHYC